MSANWLKTTIFRLGSVLSFSLRISINSSSLGSKVTASHSSFKVCNNSMSDCKSSKKSGFKYSVFNSKRPLLLNFSIAASSSSSNISGKTSLVDWYMASMSGNIPFLKTGTVFLFSVHARMLRQLTSILFNEMRKAICELSKRRTNKVRMNLARFRCVPLKRLYSKPAASTASLTFSSYSGSTYMTGLYRAALNSFCGTISSFMSSL